MFSVASLRAVGSALWRVPELRRRVVSWRDRWTEVAVQLCPGSATQFYPGRKFPPRESPRLWGRVENLCICPETSPRWMSLDGICSGFRRASACPATLNTSRWTEKNEACSWTRKCSMTIHVKYRISETDAHSLARYLPIFQSGFHSFSSIKPLI